MCYAADPANNLGMGMDTGTAANVLVGRYQKNILVVLLFILKYADTICGATGAAATAVTAGPAPLASGTYANFDHIVIPGGKETNCNKVKVLTI